MEFSFSEETETLDQVPESFRGAYVEKDGRYVLKEDMKPFADAINGLNRANRAARADVKRYKGQTVDLSPLEEFGTSPEEIATTFKARLEEATTSAKTDQKGAIERYKAELEKNHTTKLQAAEQRAATYKNALYREVVTAGLTQAIAEERGSAALLVPVLERMVGVVEEQDEKGNMRFRQVVLDERGEERLSVATGQPMTVRELVKELKPHPEYARAFDADVATGGGARRSSAVTPAKTGTQAPVDKIAAGLSARRRG